MARKRTRAPSAIGGKKVRKVRYTGDEPLPGNPVATTYADDDINAQALTDSAYSGQAIPGLTRDEQALIEEAFSSGPGALYERGMNAPQIKEFIARPEVTDYFKVLESELRNSESYDMRTRFMVRRQLAKHAKVAAETLVLAVTGTQRVSRNIDGSPRMTPDGKPLTKTVFPLVGQTIAASEILDRLGCRAPARLLVAGADLSIIPLLSKAAESATSKLLESTSDEKYMTKALSRERVRNAIEKMMDKVVDGAGKLKEYAKTGQLAHLEEEDANDPAPAKK